MLGLKVYRSTIQFVGEISAESYKNYIIRESNAWCWSLEPERPPSRRQRWDYYAEKRVGRIAEKFGF